MTASTGEHRHSLLEDLVDRLELETAAFEPALFEPARDIRSARARDLPGREPGTHLEIAPQAAHRAARALLDCGISRRDGYTHVLWVSLSAESILGPAAYIRLAEVIGALEYVTAYDWEGQDRLHLRAPGVDWDALLGDARQAVDALMG